MKLSELQNALCNLYGIEGHPNVEDFLVGITASGRGERVGNREFSRESLIVRSVGDEVELGLFIAPEIIYAVRNLDPLDAPDAFSCAVEGVSHFVYVCDRIDRGLTTTKLELEIQGEVDKFLILQLISAAEGGGDGLRLFNMQFESHSYDSNLSPEDRQTYETASRLAAKFCHTILGRCFNPVRIAELIPLAREFFLKDLQGKIRQLTP